MSHGDRVISLPKGFEVLGKSEGSPFAIFGSIERKMYGIMFHPEVVHTPEGGRLLRNFVHNIAGIEGDWTMRAYREHAVEAIRKQVGKGKVICALSGAVDSSVAALSIPEAVGDQLTCILLDMVDRNDGASGVVAMSRSTTICRSFWSTPQTGSSRRWRRATREKARPSAACSSRCSRRRRRTRRRFRRGHAYPDVIESVSFTGTR